MGRLGDVAGIALRLQDEPGRRLQAIFEPQK